MDRTSTGFLNKHVKVLSEFNECAQKVWTLQCMVKGSKSKSLQCLCQSIFELPSSFLHVLFSLFSFFSYVFIKILTQKAQLSEFSFFFITEFQNDCKKNKGSNIKKYQWSDLFTSVEFMTSALIKKYYS